MMRQFKIVILTLMLSSFWINYIYASNDGNILRIKFLNGEEIGFLLENKPVVTFDAENVIVSTDDFQTILPYKYSLIEKIDFLDTSSSGVEQNTINNALSITYLDGENLVINGVQPKMQCHVYGLDGKQYQVNANLAGNVLTISLSPLVNGIYIIRVDNYSFKIRKK